MITTCPRVFLRGSVNSRCPCLQSQVRHRGYERWLHHQQLLMLPLGRQGPVVLAGNPVQMVGYIYVPAYKHVGSLNLVNLAPLCQLGKLEYPMRVDYSKTVFILRPTVMTTYCPQKLMLDSLRFLQVPPGYTAHSCPSTCWASAPRKAAPAAAEL